MANLILMSGVPGSGKTTFCKNYLMRPKDYYISRDEIRFSMVSEDQEYFSKENEVMKTFINKIDEAIDKNNYDVYADATHLTPNSRAKLLKNLKNKPDNIVVVFMDTDLETAIYQNNLRCGRAHVPESAIIKMYNSIIMPQKFEDIDKVLIVKDNKIQKEVRL